MIQHKYTGVITIQYNMRPFSVNRGKHISPDVVQLEREYIHTEEDSKYDYNPFSLTQLQPYIPIYSTFLDISPEDENNIALNNPLEFSTLSTVIHKEVDGFPKLQKDVFIKFSPILDPIKYMSGKYVQTQINLPSMSRASHPKIDNVYNASYVDGFFCYLSSQLMQSYHNPHCIEYYGSHLAFQRKFKMVMDDLDYLMESPYFITHVNKQFFISGDAVSLEGANSRCNKPKLEFNEDCDIELDAILIDEPPYSIDDTEVLDVASNNMDLVYECETKEGKEECADSSDISDDSDSDNSEVSYSSSDDDEDEEEESEVDMVDLQDSDSDEDNEGDEDEDDEEEGDDEDDEEDDEEDEPEIYAYVNDFPIQMICLEKCVGTFDDLIMKGKIDEYSGASALFQIIMALIIYQKAFHFTHNDLHTNNVMYVNTDKKYLYYNYGGVKYRVPTYGRIYKIIDFGRSIYQWNGKRYCSDSFQNGGDAATQYNCEPFFDENKPRLEPNYSFDLCRLGVSIYDYVIDDDESPDDMDDFQKIIYRWCTDDNGKNILYKKNGEERYPNFKLYKMIARTVHNHCPEAQLDDPLFSEFRLSSAKWEKSGDSSLLIDIDKIPFLG